MIPDRFIWVINFGTIFNKPFSFFAIYTAQQVPEVSEFGLKLDSLLLTKKYIEVLHELLT